MAYENRTTALYERLSRDDDLQGESNSISMQKQLLWEFAARNGLPSPMPFSDDGISGTRFDRPEFLRMMGMVEEGRIGCICVKDMSRLGRDYLQVGQIMEHLRQRGVRLIAVNDGTDTDKGKEDEMTAFRNVINEMYCRDTSKKIKSTFKSKGMTGKHLTGTVIYGYLWDANREYWIVDEEAAAVVRRAFELTMAGYGPYQISKMFSAEKIEIPSVHLAKFGEGVNKNKQVKDPYGWGSSTIVNMLKKREYLGHTVNFKTQKHFKDKKSHYVSEDQWVVFENTHPAIIDQETFDNVQRIRGNVRRYPNGWGEAAPLTGLMYCADCGGKMYVHRVNNGKRINQYTCAEYSKVPVGTRCLTQHRIKEEDVLTLIKDLLKAIAEYARCDRDEFLRMLQEAQASQQTVEIKKQRTRLAAAKQRYSELEMLACKIYEDNAIGKLTDARYAILDAQYEKEQTALTAEISALEKAIAEYGVRQKSADKFLALIDRYTSFDELTTTMINEFVEKIVVHERDRKGCTMTTQKVDIYFNFIGNFVPPDFAVQTPEEIKAMEEMEALRQKRHEAYLKRKASGTYKRYADKVKAQKKAEMDAKKDAIRQEDMENGVFTPVAKLPKLEPQRAAANY